jgi:sugar lactone lactonase YvrE
LHAPNGIALDEAFVYVTVGSGSVFRVPKKGGLPDLVSSGPEGFGPIVVDGTNVYWSTLNGLLSRAPKTGGASIMMFAPESGAVGRLARDSKNVYLPIADTEHGAIQRVAISGNEPLSLAKPEVPVGIAVDDSAVYWSEEFTGAIMRVPKTGGEATIVVPPSDHGAFAVFVDATHLYWSGLDLIARMPKDGGEVQVISTAARFPTIMLVDETNVYWTNTSETKEAPISTEISKAPLDGGPAILIVTGQQHIGFLAQDSERLYWTDREAGTVMSVAK